MSGVLIGKRIAFVMANEGVEQIELTKPLEAARDAGATVEIIATNAGEVQAFNHLDKADTFPVNKTTSSVSADDYDGVVLPGGVVNPDQLRTDAAAVSFIRDIGSAGKPIAAICHGPWTLIEAGIVDGKKVTSWPSLQTDLRNAGATWVDEEVVVDKGLVTSRKPDDLEAFCDKMIEELSEGEHESMT
jgi:protease I